MLTQNHGGASSVINYLRAQSIEIEARFIEMMDMHLEDRHNVEDGEDTLVVPSHILDTFSPYRDETASFYPNSAPRSTWAGCFWMLGMEDT